MFTMSVWPILVDRLTLCPPARSMFVVMVTYLVEIFFFVWTVAYNFVPGGVYTREHTDVLMAVVMIGIFIGMFLGQCFIHALHIFVYIVYFSPLSNIPIVYLFCCSK